MTAHQSKEDIKQNLKEFIEKASRLERKNLELQARVADLQQEIDEVNDSSAVRQQICQESWGLQASEYANKVKYRCVEECQRLQRSYQTHGASLLSAERILRQNSEHTADVYKAVAQSNSTKSLVTLKDFDIADGHIGVYNHSGVVVNLAGYSIQLAGLLLADHKSKKINKERMKSCIVLERKHVIAPHSFISIWWDDASKDRDQSVRDSPDNGSFFVHYAAVPTAGEGSMGTVAHLYGPKDNWLSSIRSNQSMRASRYSAQDEGEIRGVCSRYNYFGDAFVGPEGPPRADQGGERTEVKKEQTNSSSSGKNSKKAAAADLAKKEEQGEQEEENEENEENEYSSPASASSPRKRKLQENSDDRSSKASNNSRSSSSCSSYSTLHSEVRGQMAAFSDTDRLSVPLPLHLGRKVGSLLFTSITMRESVGADNSSYYPRRSQQQRAFVHSVECMLCNFSNSSLDIGGWGLMCVNESRIGYFAVPLNVIIAPHEHVLLTDIPSSAASSSSLSSSPSTQSEYTEATTPHGSSSSVITDTNTNRSTGLIGIGASFSGAASKMHSYVTAAAQKARASQQLKKSRTTTGSWGRGHHAGNINSNNNTDDDDGSADNSVFSLSLNDGGSITTAATIAAAAQTSFGVERLFGQHSINAQLNAAHLKSRPKTIVPQCIVRLPGLTKHCNGSGALLAVYLLKPPPRVTRPAAHVQVVDLTGDGLIKQNASNKSSSCSWLKNPTSAVSVCSAVLSEYRLRIVAESAISSSVSSNIEPLHFENDANGHDSSSNISSAPPEFRFFGSSNSSASSSDGTTVALTSTTTNGESNQCCIS